MALFLSTYLNKIDRKGRVSVPAAYRKTLEDAKFRSVMGIQSHAIPAIECMTPDRMELLAASIEGEHKFSARESDFSLMVFSSAADLPWDNDGRIILPDDLIAHAGLSDQALFAGAGSTFHIWEPGRFKQRQAEARERAQRDGMTVNLLVGRSINAERKP